MLRVFRSAVLIVAFPVLVLFALAFQGILLLIKFAGRLFGREIVWPPVLVDEVEAVADEQERIGMARR